MLLNEGQASRHSGAALILAQPPAGARELLADRGYDSTHFGDTLTARGIDPCISSTRSRKRPILHDATLHKQNYRIETNFGRPKDWSRIPTRYDQCTHTFFIVIALAATIPFWLGQ